METKKIEEILLEGNYVEKDDIEKGREFAKSRKGSILDYLLKEEKITKDLLGQAFSEYFGIPYADINSKPPTREQVLKIPEKIARKRRLVIFKEDENNIILATDSPNQNEADEKEAEADLAILKNVFSGKEIKIYYSLTEDIESAFFHYRTALDTRFNKIIKSKFRIAPEIINEIIKDALSYKASDIHFDPQEKEVVIRFRIDGILHEAGRISKDYYENILNRIKVQAHLKTDEHFSAQDGAIRYQSENEIIDMRVSIAPVIDGEKIVLRLIGEYIKNFNLGEIGLSKKNEKIILETADKPFGMIIVAGPTGSGKSTTLYSLLKMLNSSEVNIATIEDPVEYKIVGVNHIQVNPQTNLTFSQGLRSIVRQDPDIILVGEIRDKETAEIAVNAALTGHLLLSTFHANDSAASIPRMLDMGIEPFLLSSTLELLIGQRLLRRICESCRYSISVSIEDLNKILPNSEKYFSGNNFNLYRGKGCKVCGNTGFKGRTAIFEFISVSEEIKDLILRNPSSEQIWKLARKQGSLPLFFDGIEKVKSGITSIEELLRISSPPN